jgi:hypothetical protein
VGFGRESAVSLPEVRPSLDMTRGFLIQFFYRKFRRRLAIGSRDKIISACNARCRLGDRVAMRNCSPRIIIIILAIAVIDIAPALFPTNAEARDPVAVTQPGGCGAGGEPGEDPHLKIDSAIQPVKDSESLDCAGGEGDGIENECIINAEGIREGREYGLGSRVNPAWRMIFWIWLWQLRR